MPQGGMNIKNDGQTFFNRPKAPQRSSLNHYEPAINRNIIFINISSVLIMLFSSNQEKYAKWRKLISEEHQFELFGQDCWRDKLTTK